MSGFDPTACSLKIIGFQVTLVPGTTQVQGATAQYEVVLPDGRSMSLSRQLDLTQVQATVNAAAQAISSQLLAAEGLLALWPAIPIVVAEQATITDQGVKS